MTADTKAAALAAPHDQEWYGSCCIASMAPDSGVVVMLAGTVLAVNDLILTQAARIADLEATNEAFGKRQEWWNERMFELEQERDTMRARIAQLEREAANLRTTMVAAAEEIHAHWDAHCNSEGYGPANLMHRLEQGIPAQYSYTAGAFAKLKERIAKLEAERAGMVAAERERWELHLSATRNLAEANSRRGDDCGMLARTFLDTLKAMKA